MKTTKIHFLLTSEKSRTISFAVSKRTIKTLLCITGAMVLFLASLGMHGIRSDRTLLLKQQVASLEKDLDTAKSTNKGYNTQITKLETEMEALLSNAVNELNQRSRVIESIFHAVGIDFSVKDADTVIDSDAGMGGSYIPFDDKLYENLLFTTDNYLDKIQAIPLGAPVPGRITSGYGRRIDPFTHKPAIHYGIDIQNKRGTKIVATADGKVVKTGYDKGYGKFIKIDHGNEFHTLFGHAKKILVKKGQRIKRGHTIGLVGNTGRSTGPHLHYEIHFKKKTINPYKYMKIAKHIPSD
ncbi:MAG: M23 family metallopeptidase [Thermodesulfobacteriota bacterium]|nr:M23 family metallopeptidase [Thermodesulfobacteriota bacterium]